MVRGGLITMGFLFGVGCGSTGDSGTSGGGGTGTGTVVVNLDGGGGPAVPPDGKAACPAGACNYQTGTGCSGATQSCLPQPSGSTFVPACIPAGPAQADAVCDPTLGCVAGHICVLGTCHKLCCGGDWSGCDFASEHCIENLSYAVGGTAVHTGAMLCLKINTCEVLSQAGCSGGAVCQIADATGVTACLPGGTGGSGDPCPCKGGFACVQPPGKSPVCVRLCSAVPGGGEPYCQATEGICTHYDRDPPTVGECQPPGGF